MNNTTLSEQLLELRRTRYAQVPRLRYIMQALLASAKHSESNRSEAQARILDWARGKWPGLVPPHAYEGKAFEHDQAGLRIAATGNADGSLWAFRSEHLGNTESRTWVTEVLVADLGQIDAFGVRNSCSTLSGEIIPTSSPRFLKDLVAHHMLVDAGVPVSARVNSVTDATSFEMFMSLLLSIDRSLPVVVLTQLPQRTDYAIEPAKLARDTQGLAHIFCISPQIAFELSDQLGKTLSVFSGAIRTYYPNFSRASDPKHHHLVFPQRIIDWEDENGLGASAFEQFLSCRLHLFSVNTPTKIEQMPSYFSIRQALLNKPNKTTGEEIELLRMEIEETRNREQAWQNQALESDSEARAYEEESRGLRAQNFTLANDLKELRKMRGEITVPIPNNYGEVQDWVNSYFANRLYLHSRAVRGLKDAVFENVALVCKSLKLLAGDYWLMRSNHDPEQRQSLSANWDDCIKKLGLEYNHQSLSPTRLGEFRDTYTIDYRIGQSSQQVLGPHLKYGGTKDNRYCMRIYFLWDDERQLVVIGSLPAHLDTRAS